MKGLGLGVVVVLDALGFKGVWTREKPSAVIRRFRSLRRSAARLQGSDWSGVLVSDSGLRHRVRGLSDSLIITVMLREPGTPARGLYRAMVSASMIAGSILLDAVNEAPSFLFRGCLAAGEMREEGALLIGPAVDEAAALHEQADGAFVWLAPSAMEINRRYAETFSDRLEPAVMIPYSMPLRSGESVDTLVFSYFAPVYAEAPARWGRWVRTRECVLRAFGEDPQAPDVARKRKHTAQFFEHVQVSAQAGQWKTPLAWREPHWTDLSTSQRLRIVSHLSKQGQDRLNQFVEQLFKDHGDLNLVRPAESDDD